MVVAVMFAICPGLWKFCGDVNAKANYAICLQRYKNHAKTMLFQDTKTQSFIRISFAAHCASPNSADFAMLRHRFASFVRRGLCGGVQGVCNAPQKYA